MFNKITTTLVAKDEVSPKLKNLQGNLKNTGVVSQGLGVVAKGAFVGIAAGVAAATAGVVGLGLAFNQASGIAQNALNAANNLSVELGDALSLNQAQDLIKTVNKELALSAAALPGTTQEYVSIFNRIQNDIARAFKNPDGTLNVEGWQKSATEISTLFGVIFSDVADRGKVENAVQKLMTGNATLRELMQYDFIASNVALVNGLADAEKRLGKEMKQWSDQERVEVLESLKDTLLSPEYLKELESSASAVLAGFQSAVFDPTTGIFGIMRELEGGGSVFESLSETVRLLFGSSGLVSTMVNDLFGVVDPMESLNKFVLRLNTFVSKLSVFYNSFNLDALTSLPRDINMSIRGFIQRFGYFISNTFSRVVSLINRSIPSLDKIFATLLTETSKLGTTILNTFRRVFNDSVAQLRTLDFQSIATSIGTFLANAIDTGIRMIFNFVRQINWGEVRGLFVDLIKAFGAGLKAFVMTIRQIPEIKQLESDVRAGLTTIVVGVKTFFEPVMQFLRDAGVIIAAGFNLIYPLIQPFIGAFKIGIVAVGAVIVGTFNLIKNNWEPISNGILFGLNLLIAPVRAFVTGLQQAARFLNWAANAIRVNRGEEAQPAFGNSFNGNFPGVFGAIARELINSPSGARPVIANSSEMILNRQQQAALFGGFSRGAANSSSNQTTIALGGISIQAGQNQSPVEIANTVIREIENRLVRAYQV